MAAVPNKRSTLPSDQAAKLVAWQPERPPGLWSCNGSAAPGS